MSSRTLRRIVPFVVLTVVFAALLYRAEHKAETGISRVDRHITEVTSPCLRYGPKSHQCKRAFEAVVATINHDEACAVLRKAGLRVASCRGAMLAQERRRHAEEPTATAPSAIAPNRGDATSSPHTGSSLPGPHGSGGESTEVAPGGEGHKKSPEKLPPSTGGEGGGTSVPGSSTSESSSQSSSSTTERVESTVETPSPEAAPVLEGVGNAVEGLGETVGGTVEHVEATTCSLAKVLC